MKLMKSLAQTQKFISYNTMQYRAIIEKIDRAFGSNQRSSSVSLILLFQTV